MRKVIQPVAAAFAEAAARHKVPAAVGMAATADKVIFTCSQGKLSAQSRRPVDSRSIFGIASMTKAITSAAALQLVERNQVELDAPMERYLPDLRNLPLLEGFDAAGKPRFAAQRYSVTLRQLLCHTAGFAYNWNHPLVFRYGPPDRPFLIHVPGSKWHYGTNIDWVGKLVERVSGQSLEAYFQQHILQPLGMTDTSFLVSPSKFDRFVSTYQRDTAGTLAETPRIQPPPPPSFNGGGGLYSTAEDYIRFTQLFLKEGQPVLGPGAFRMMTTNQVGNLPAGPMHTTMPERSRDADFHPGEIDRFTFGFLLNPKPHTGARSADSLAWAGIRNTFYWIDRKRGLSAVLMMHFLPFCDDAAMGMLRDFERMVYTHTA